MFRKKAVYNNIVLKILTGTLSSCFLNFITDKFGQVNLIFEYCTSYLIFYDN